MNKYIKVSIQKYQSEEPKIRLINCKYINSYEIREDRNNKDYLKICYDAAEGKTEVYIVFDIKEIEKFLLNKEIILDLTNCRKPYIW